MAAELLTHTTVGGPLSGSSANSGAGMKWGLYDVTCTENDDWIVLSEFDEIKFAVVVSDSTGAMTPAEVTIDETTTNKLVFTNGSTNDLHVFAVGTPAVSS